MAEDDQHLLAGGDEGLDEREVGETSKDKTPAKSEADNIPSGLPWDKLVVLLLIQFTEAFATTQLVPYAPRFVRHLLNQNDDAHHCPQDADGEIYVGLLNSCFSIAQFISSFIWGNLADQFGRRPILLIGLFGNMATLPIFGFSSTLTMAILTRLLCGLVNGNVGIVRTYLGEVLHRTQLSKGFGLLALSYSAGMIMGPLMAGMMTYDPWIDDEYCWDEHRNGPFVPDRSHWLRGTLFEDFPYALPNILSACFTALALLIGFFTLTETLVLESAEEKTQPLLVDEEAEQKKKASPKRLGTIEAMRLLGKNRNFLIAAAQYSILSLVFLMFMTIFPLWASLDDERSGWEWPESNIGVVQGLGGVGILLTQLLLFARLVKRFGLLRTFKLAWIPVFVLLLSFPLLELLQTDGARWAVMAPWMLLFFSFTGVIYTVTFVLINNSVPNSQKGSANGLGQSLASLVRAFGPVLGAAIFSLGVDSEPSDGGFWRYFPVTNRHAPFYLMIYFGVASLLLNFLLPDSMNFPFDNNPLTSAQAEQIEDIVVADDVSDGFGDDYDRTVRRMSHASQMSDFVDDYPSISDDEVSS
ncbi:MAG: hypothetical protein MHM6MM_005721 [Cercozoa sp. M6MM]